MQLVPGNLLLSLIQKLSPYLVPSLSPSYEFLGPHATYQFSWAQESCLCITQAPKAGCWRDLSGFMS